MRGYFKAGFAVLAAFALIVNLGGALAGAQNDGGVGNGFRITPVRSELTIEKGRQEVLEISIENPTDAKITAVPVVNDFVASDSEDGEPRLILEETDDARPKNSLKDLVQDIESVELGPHEKKEVPVTLSVPEDASSGGYYGAIRFVPAETSGDGNVGLSASVGTIVLVRVPGDLTERLDLVQLSAAQDGKAKGFLTSGNVQVLTRLKNSGDIHVQPFGKVQVKNMFGKTVAEYELNDSDPRANILPDSTRRFVDGLSDQSWLGRYTISANLGYAQGSGDVITAQSSFWYLPAWAIAVLVAALAALVFGGYLLYNKYASPTRRKRK